MPPCIDVRARPPPSHGDVSPRPKPPPSGTIVAHATATKEAPGRRWDPDSSPSQASHKVHPPSASPSEPSPVHARHCSVGRCREVIDEDASSPKKILDKIQHKVLHKIQHKVLEIHLCGRGGGDVGPATRGRLRLSGVGGGRELVALARQGRREFIDEPLVPPRVTSRD